jgi:hypothetical protein
MLMVASRHAITASAPATLVDVIAGVPGLTVVDDALMDRGCPIPLRCGLGMNSTGCSEASPWCLEAELLAYCMATVWRRP